MDLQNPSHSIRLRLAFVLSSNLGQWAGIEHTLYQYCIHKPDDVEVTIFQPDFNPSPRISDKEVNALFSGVNIRTFSGYFNKCGFLEGSEINKTLTEVLIIPFLAFVLKHSVLWKLRSELERFDVVYFFSSNRESRLVSGKKPILIGSVHGWFLSNNNLLKRLELKLVENGIAMHNLQYFHVFPAQYALLKMESDKRKFFAIPNGVESGRYTPIEINGNDNSPIRFLFNGRLEDCKGVLKVIKAFKSLEINESVELHIVGSGSLEDRIESQTDHRIYLHGFVSEAKLAGVVSSCDVLVYPSLCDSFSLVVLNSLSSGLHIITTEEISRNFTPFLDRGFITLVDSIPDNIAKAMRKTVKNIQEIRNARSECHGMVAKRYDWSLVSMELYSKIKELYVKPFSKLRDNI